MQPFWATLFRRQYNKEIWQKLQRENREEWRSGMELKNNNDNNWTKVEKRQSCLYAATKAKNHFISISQGNE